MLNEQRSQERSVIKMLLLGAGESGKSTIFKQLRILNNNGFTETDRIDFKKTVHFNIISAIRDVCKACKDFGIMYGSDENRQRGNRMTALNPKTANPVDYQNDIAMLWQDTGIKTAMKRTNEFYIIDSADYFLGTTSLARICQANYLPSDQDILRCRKATNGIVSMDFTQEKTCFKVYDVGGQRGKRNKWIQCFDGVTAIIFVASLSEYDQELMEMKGKNRMEDSLNLFEGITKLQWFKKTPVILFLNKRDILQEKIKHYRLSDYFPAYEGGDDFEKAQRFIRSMYEGRKLKDGLYCHFTCATDTENMKFVLRATVDIIMKKCLENYGLGGGMT